MNTNPIKIYCADNGIFPNSRLPVLLYKKVIVIPHLLAAKKIKSLFSENDWAMPGTAASLPIITITA